MFEFSYRMYAYKKYVYKRNQRKKQYLERPEKEKE